jgi:hypothetical protein
VVIVALVVIQIVLRAFGPEPLFSRPDEPGRPKAQIIRRPAGERGLSADLTGTPPGGDVKFQFVP